LPESSDIQLINLSQKQQSKCCVM